MQEDELYIKMGEDDWKDIVINNKLHIHLKTCDRGYSADFYKYNMTNPQEDDFLFGYQISNEELNLQKEVNNDD